MSDDQDAAARKAAELLPCECAPNAEFSRKPAHGGRCPAQYRSAVADALRGLKCHRCAGDEERIVAYQKRITELEAELERAKGSRPN